MERDGGSNGSNPVGIFLHATTTFYGAGVTDSYENPSYIGYGTAQHDYENAYHDGAASADEVLSTGPIENNPGDVPYDEYTVSVVHLCGGFSTCY